MQLSHCLPSLLADSYRNVSRPTFSFRTTKRYRCTARWSRSIPPAVTSTICCKSPSYLQQLALPSSTIIRVCTIDVLIRLLCARVCIIPFHVQLRASSCVGAYSNRAVLLPPFAELRFFKSLESQYRTTCHSHRRAYAGIHSRTEGSRAMKGAGN